MSSIVPGFEYDIFISYRHNDNLDGWVTQFAKDLEQELRGTLKHPVSIYFDKNASDGLLETHSVDKSLEGKLKSLIFIPVVSQTYCDQKSFAWQHELCAFTRLLKDDPLGKDIRLAGGNVASRILPVKIHDLDADDKSLLEAELGGALRAVDFIYKEPGVNRPLKPTDNKQDNQYHADYRNQVNKLANAVKELLASMTHVNLVGKPPVTVTHEVSKKPIWRKRSTIAAALLLIVSAGGYSLYNLGASLLSSPANERSIAVLPFENMSEDPGQDYFSSGITEDILNHLVKVADLKVKSRTSTLQYKGTQKSMTEIGQELEVKNVVEGSVRRVGNKVRVVVQLIDTETDVHIWSETYDRQLEDVLAMQSEIAIEIANALKAQLSASEKQNIQRVASVNISAYDYYLRAKSTLEEWSDFRKVRIQAAMRLTDEAIRLDPTFARAYALKGLCWYFHRYLAVSQRLWQDSAIFYSDKAIAIDPNSPDGYLVQARIHETTGNMLEAATAIDMAYRLAPNDPDALDAEGYRRLSAGDESGAGLALRALQSKFSSSDPRYWIWLADIHRDMGVPASSEKLYLKASSLDPAMLDTYWKLTILYTYMGELDKGLEAGQKAERIYPRHPGVVDAMAWLHLVRKDSAAAARYWGMYAEIEATFEDSTQFLPYRQTLGMLYREMGRKKEGDALVIEDLKRYLEVREGKRSIGVWLGMSAVYYGIGVDYIYLGNNDKAVQYLDSAEQHNLFHYESYHLHPLVITLENREDFRRIQKRVADYREFNKMAFTRAFKSWQGKEGMKAVLE